jgi:CRISPR/Cas system endoribonuclease Cas6 (RAMP superfamily)
MVVEDYDLRTHRVQFVGHPQMGFIGSCSYLLRGPDETSPGYPQGVSLHVHETPPNAPMTVRQQILLLAQFAFYCGVGYKTPMGMGRVRML